MNSIPRGKKPLTRTTTFTLPTGGAIPVGVRGTVTGVFDLKLGLEAEVGVFALPSKFTTVRAAGAMASRI